MNSLPKLVVEPPAPDPEVRPNFASWYTPGLSDGLGDRLLMFDNSNTPSLELLRFKREFTAVPGFDAALRQRVDELAGFSHPNLARVRTVEWLGTDGLALVSNHTVGRRLSELLHDARGPQFATELILQVAPVLAALQHYGRGFAHGALTPDRVVVTPEGRLIVVEHVAGSAIEALGLPAWRLRSELGIAVPLGAGDSVLDARQDLMQLGYMALSLLLGRRIDPADDHDDVVRLLDDATRSGPGRAESPQYLRRWLERALQVNASRFLSAHDAHLALEDWPEGQRRGPDRSHKSLEARMAAELPERKPIGIDPREILVDFPPEDEIKRLRSVEKIEPINRRVPMFEHGRTGLPEDVEALQIPDEAPVAQEAPVSFPDQFPETPTVSPRGLPAAVRWALMGLSTVAVAEAFVIAGLLLRTPPAGTEAAAVPAIQPIAAVAPAASPAPQNPAVVPSPTAAQGRLEVSSDPPGARVVVDGSPRGTTPVSVLVSAGTHTVEIAGGGGTTRRTVNVAAGTTSSLVASLTPAGATGGWVSIDVPLDLQVMEAGQLLGTTRAERIMLPAGRHDLQLTNAALGFQQNLSVDIQPGRTVTTRVAIPNGVLSLNALPWANVSLDGQALGTTPLANLAVPIGTHEVILRHPQFGERRQSVTVTTGAPVRLVVDLTR